MKLKSIFTIAIFSFIWSNTFAESGKVFQFYKVLSDTIDTSVPDGKCLIVGTVYRNRQTINEAYIVSENGKGVNSNKIGQFKILIDTSNHYLIIKKHPFNNAYVEDYKFKSNHKVTINIYFPRAIEEEIIKVKKPIIYAYNQTPLDFSLRFETKSKNVFTYPDYFENEQWNMTTTQDGMLKDQNNKQYPYLFWDGELSQLNFKIENKVLIGSQVYTESVVEYLENSLAQLGLNEREQTDFITFWAPRMIQHDEVYVQFLIDDDYEVISTMEITPKPDNMRRVYLIFTAIENIPTNIELQQQDFDFAPLDRSGFTIMEWGGSEINNVVLSNN